MSERTRRLNGVLAGGRKYWNFPLLFPRFLLQVAFRRHRRLGGVLVGGRKSVIFAKAIAFAFFPSPSPGTWPSPTASRWGFDMDAPIFLIHLPCTYGHSQTRPKSLLDQTIAGP